MAKIFESLRMSRPKYSAFDLSHERKFSCEQAELIPILCEEIVPGDQYNVKSEIMLRYSPMIAPIMHRVNVFVHYFFVPNRIVWNDWEDFITGGKDGLSTPTVPTLQASNTYASPGSLADYLGIQGVNLAGANKQDVSQLPFRAYQQIYNDYFRDETLSVEVDLTSIPSITTLRLRQWEKDYFTSSLPWTQRGPNTEVPITFDAQATGSADKFYNVTTGATINNETIDTSATGSLIGQTGLAPGTVDNSDKLQITINDLRTSSRLQEWLEKNARGGYRYIEQLLSHFGVKSSDARLQRAEYLGGGRQPLTISEVVNTSAISGTPQGTLAGHGISVGTANKMRSRFEEHGWLFGIMSVLPRTAYQDNLHRKFQRFDKLDYYFPEFAHLGEQAVLNKEIYYDANDTDAVNNGVFGYQQRYGEMKYGCSSVHGDFRNTLDFWHQGRIFSARPSLNNAFTEADPTERIFAVTTGDNLWCQVYNDVKARRPMPYFGTPKL